MNTFSWQKSVMMKGSICLLGLVGSASFLAAPASAEPAAARGAVTIVRPSGSSLSVSGEMTLPTGMYFGPSGTNATLSIGLGASASLGVLGAGTNAEAVTQLTLNAGTPTERTNVSSENPFLNAAAAKLTNATAIEDQAAIIRAGAGINGLGSLE